MKKQFKYVGDRYVGATAIKDGTLKMVVNPGDIIEIDTDKCIVKNRSGAGQRLYGAAPDRGFVLNRAERTP